jgi:hypothetical protein
MREEFIERLTVLRKDNNVKFGEYTSYVCFFELLGMYVKNGYVPLRDVIQVYKGPILNLDTSWREFIGTWEKRAHVPKGLLENAIFLMDMTRIRTSRPIYYWTIYRFRRYFETKNYLGFGSRGLGHIGT